MSSDPWTVLGIRRGASARQVHDAWRRRASRWHPDRNRSPDATLRLQEINDAYASIQHGAERVWVGSGESILAGVSGTVFGQDYEAVGALAADCVRATLTIPLANWFADSPVTLGIPMIEDFTALVTFMHPGRLRNGSIMVFPSAGLAAHRRVTDLVVTIRIRVPAIDGPPAAQLRA